MTRSSKVKTRLLILVAFFALLGVFSPRIPSVHAAPVDPTVTVTKHANLGFTTSVPFTAHPNDCFVFGAFCYDVHFTGTANVVAQIGADITLSYDSAKLVPNGMVPVHFTYTPTSGGSHVSVDISGMATSTFTLCGDCPEHQSLTLGAGGGTFTAPMGSDTPVTISGSSSTLMVGLNFPNPIGFVDFADLSLSSALTLAPAAAGSLPGLGGAAGILSADGATLTSLPILEWDMSGASVSGTIQLPASVSGGLGLTLLPLLHWLSTSGDVNLNIHLTGAFKGAVAAALGIICGPCALASLTINDPSPIGLFSGSLGTVYTSIGLDTMIGNAVGPPAGSLVAARVAAGFIPIPLLTPALASIPPVPTPLGSITFSIPGVAITGTPTEAVLAGSTVSLSASVSRGTGPFSYSWTRNGLPFATTHSITDAAVAGTTVYAVTVTDSLGAVSNTDHVTINGYDFTISLAPSSFTVPHGAPATYTVTLVLTGGAGLAGVPSHVSTSMLGLPTGAKTVGFPTSLLLNTIPVSVTFNVNTTTITPTGTYTLTAKGTTDTGSRTGTASLIVITPQQATQNLINSVNGLGLSKGTTMSLDAKLGEVSELITAGNTSGACAKLDAFIGLVSGYLKQGELTLAQANQLIQQATLIQISLNC